MKKLFFAVILLCVSVNLYSLDEPVLDEPMNNEWALGNTPEIGIDEGNREALSQMLNRILADEYVLYTKAQNYHWNVLGVHFNDLHAFFSKIYEQQQGVIDRVAERVRALGGRAEGSLEEFLNNSRVKEQLNGALAPQEMVKNLLADTESIIRNLRKDIDDAISEYEDTATNNMLTEIIEMHEKTAWMLRSLDDEKFSSDYQV